MKQLGLALASAIFDVMAAEATVDVGSYVFTLESKVEYMSNTEILLKDTKASDEEFKAARSNLHQY